MGFVVCCRGAWAAGVGVGGPPPAWCAAAALALAVALWMRSAGKGGSEEEVEDIDDDEDQQEVVVFADVGCAAIWAGRALFAAAASAAATAGRMEGMSSGCGSGAGGLGGPAVTWRPSGPIWSAAVGGVGAGLRSPPSRLGWAVLLQCVRSCGSVSAGGNNLRGLRLGIGGSGLGFRRGVRGACAGHWAGWVCCGAWGSSRRVCVGCRVWGVVRGARREGRWWACVVDLAGGGDPCRGAWGCSRWWACAGRRCWSSVGGCGAGFVCVVSMYVSACSSAPVWSLVGRAVWRRSLPSSAAGARILQMSVRIWCTSWSVVGTGYCSGGLRSMWQRTLWMLW